MTLTKQRFLAAALASVLAGTLAFLTSGCGDDSGNPPAETSPAAKAANADIQEANRKAMQSKGGAKGKTAGKPAPKH
jgi:hypothetical protein